MNAAELVKRASAIKARYEQYLPDESKPKKKEKHDDPFVEEYVALVEKIEELEREAQATSQLSDRAKVATQNAQMRRKKAEVKEKDFERLTKVIKKGSKLTKEVVEDRYNKAEKLLERIDAIPDGISSGRQRPTRVFGLAPAKKPKEVQLSHDASVKLNSNPLYYEHTDETKQFEQEWQLAKGKQDEKLDRIGKGVDQLKQVAVAMGEEFDKQDGLLDEIEAGLDTVTKELETNNMKLKGVLESVRQTRRICLDITLAIVLLAIFGYMYTQFK